MITVLMKWCQFFLERRRCAAVHGARIVNQNGQGEPCGLISVHICKTCVTHATTSFTKMISWGWLTATPHCDRSSRVSSYRYLGVQLTTSVDYLVTYEKQVHKKALRRQWILKARVLWAFSRMKVVQSLWKAVMVPGITFGNAVLCLSSAVREFMKQRQHEVGTQALGAHR